MPTDYRPMRVPETLMDRLDKIQAEQEAVNRELGRINPKPTYPQVIEMLLDNWDATARLVKGVVERTGAKP